MKGQRLSLLIDRVHCITVLSFMICRYITSENQGDHSPDTAKFPDISLTICGILAHVKW